ncbi:MAG: cytochrome c maturation protein CcmE [Dehalococcoidales bacterium]
MLRKKRFLIGGIIVFLAIGYLAFMGFQSSATYYYTVSELKDQGSSVYGENVRIKGEVAPGSVEQENVGGTLKFTIIDGEESLPVAYDGVVPDTFKVGVEVVVEGKLDSGGTFQAYTLMPKCPSRYVPQ